jgi:hypothetical protein
MAKSTQSTSKSTLPPQDGGQGRMPRLFLEIRWFLTLGLCLGLIAILVTYSKSDPAWSHWGVDCGFITLHFWSVCLLVGCALCAPRDCGLA